MDQSSIDLSSPSQFMRRSFRGWTAPDTITLDSRVPSDYSANASIGPKSQQKLAFSSVDAITPENAQPGGRLKRLYTVSVENLQALMRTLGLGIVTVLRVRRRKNARGEPIKVAIRHNRVTALLRTMIHVVPVGLTLWLVILNWNTYYVGSYTHNLFYYQVGAKILEIMIQASLTAIIFSYIRHELAIGNGLPFGALFSGLQISQISYLWSKELWGSVTSRYLPYKRKICMLLMIIVCFFLAAAAGPSSASLLIPRLDYWPAGSAQIWINATRDELWPTKLDASSILALDHCSTLPYIQWSDGCPASEWEAAFTWFLKEAYSAPVQLENITFDRQSLESLQVTGKNSIRQLSEVSPVGTYQLSNTSGKSETAYFSCSVGSTQHAAIADALIITAGMWSNAIRNAKPARGHGAPLFDMQESVHTLDDYYQPYVVTICGVDTIQGSDDRTAVYFPASPPQYSHAASGDGKLHFFVNGVLAQIYPSLTKSQIYNLPGPTSANRVKWVQIPHGFYNSSSLGVVILQPRQEDASLVPNKTQTAMFCRIEAGWGLSTMNVSTTGGASSRVSSIPNLTDLPKNIRGSYDEYDRVQTLVGGRESQSFYEVQQEPIVWDYGLYPSIPITIAPEWAEFLNPVIPTINDTILNTIFAFLEFAAAEPEYEIWQFTQEVLSLLTANAIARVSFDREIQGTPKLMSGPNGSGVYIDGTAWLSGKQVIFSVDPEESEKWTKFKVISTIKGYAYNTHGFGPKVAIAFLLMYCAVAFVHIFYSGITGLSSTAWDSISEVTALAMNSTPTVALRNTCAGITEMHIFRTPVRILAFMDAEGESEHLEMVFGHELREEDESRTIKANRAYGTLPASLRKWA